MIQLKIICKQMLVNGFTYTMFFLELNSSSIKEIKQEMIKWSGESKNAFPNCIK